MSEIGPYTLYSVETGRFGLDGGAMFGIVPKPLWSKRLAPDEQNRVPLHMRCLLLRGDDRLILIDTGIGDLFAGTKYEDIYAVDHSFATLDGQLGELGFTTGDVTDVVLTHLHFDHCGGATRATEEGRAVRFPNATYHVQRDHWAWAREPNPKEQGSFINRALRPLKEADALHLIDGETRLFPRISVRCVHGHTEAQQIVHIADGQTTLVYVADLLPTSAHLGAAWTMAFDIRPLQTIEEKKKFLGEAENKEWNLFFEHDPHVEVGNLRRTERGFEVVNDRSIDEL